MSGYVILTGAFHEEGDQWVGECLELGTAIQADSIGEAQDILGEAIVLHIQSLSDVGELGRVLIRKNITFFSKKPRLARINLDAPVERFSRPFVEKIPALADE